MWKVIRVATVIALFVPGPVETQAQDVQPKNPTLAFALSGLGALMPGTVVYYRLTDGTAELDGTTFGILAGGIIIGPALGHIYTENLDRVWGGIAIRLLAGVASTAGAYGGILIVLGGGNPVVAGLFLAGGIIVAGTSAVLDIVRAPASAQAWNRRHIISVYPSSNPQTASYGVAISLTF